MYIILIVLQFQGWINAALIHSSWRLNSLENIQVFARLPFVCERCILFLLSLFTILEMFHDKNGVSKHLRSVQSKICLRRVESTISIPASHSCYKNSKMVASPWFYLHQVVAVSFKHLEALDIKLSLDLTIRSVLFSVANVYVNTDWKFL